MAQDFEGQLLAAVPQIGNGQIAYAASPGYCLNLDAVWAAAGAPINLHRCDGQHAEETWTVDEASSTIQYTGPPFPRPVVPLEAVGQGRSGLGHCQGDCDDDGDCGSGLYCFKRPDTREVPGCSGAGSADWDYCVLQTPHKKHPHTVHLPLGALLRVRAPCVAQV